MILAGIEKYINKVCQRGGTDLTKMAMTYAASASWPAVPPPPPTITLYTYEGNAKVIQLLFGDRVFRCVTEKEVDPYRSGHNSEKYDKKYPGIKNLYLFLWENGIPVVTCLTHLHASNYGHMSMAYNYISKPISYPNNPHTYAPLSEDRDSGLPIFIFFFRRRDHELWRNYDRITENGSRIQTYVDDIFKNERNLCVIYNENTECFVPPSINVDSPNVRLCSDFGELLALFSKCSNFVTSSTGLTDVAKCCGCKCLTFIADRDNKLFYNDIFYNPFNAKINVLSNCESIGVKLWR